jgi:predicted DNA-binding protein
MFRTMSRKHGKGALKPVPVNIPPGMDSEVTKLAAKSGLTKAAIMRLAIERGLGAVEKMFEPHQKAA